MRLFEKGNWSGKTACPVCKTNKDGQVTLIPKIGTGDNPKKKFQNFEAKQAHLDCLDLWFDEKNGFIIQKINTKNPTNKNKGDKNL